jgi:tetratricopeptide (TPR) repeat protein
METTSDDEERVRAGAGQGTLGTDEDYTSSRPAARHSLSPRFTACLDARYNSLVLPRASDWPFLQPLVPPIPRDRREIHVADLHEAFVNYQTANTRLVTTNASYLMQTVLHAIGDRADVRIIATADPASLAEHAPEALGRRGPFADRRIELVLETRPVVSPDRLAPAGPSALLPAAFRTRDPQERLALCIAALDAARTAPALLAAASTCMEVNDLDAAARDLDEAIVLAPDWAAAHFERGKLWLRRDDMSRSADSFRRAVTLLPPFTAGWANLGATLGELDRRDEALAAFETALAQDPDNAQALNNVGVLRRELGQLEDSATALRRVTELAPERAFGYYNLGHTLFLQGRYHAALTAYAEGQRRDREPNPVQATRLAMCRLATGDASGALADLRQATAPLPGDYKRQLLADTQTLAWALLTHRSDIAGWNDVNGWIGAELAKLT